MTHSLAHLASNRAMTALFSRISGGSIQISERDRSHRYGKVKESDTRPPITVGVQVHDPRVYGRLLRAGSIGLGESYADGWWDADDLTGVLRLAARSIARSQSALNRLHRAATPAIDPIARLRRTDRRRERRNVRAHYDLGNDFFEAMLDESMMYSCAVFERPGESLSDASRNKLDRLARLLRLGEGDRVLEIGTGWGGFALHAAQHYGCHVTTTTISPRQYEYARERVRRAGLGGRVTVLDLDYRDVRGTFDKAVAIEMIEAVSWRDYETFFGNLRARIHDAGAIAIQAITAPEQSFDRMKRNSDFINTVIFPGGCLPSVAAMTRAASLRSDLRLASRHTIGAHYPETLRRWRRNLDEHRGAFGASGFDRRFARLWTFYLAYCEAAFEEGRISAEQLLYAAPMWPHATIELDRPTTARADPDLASRTG